MMKKLLNLKVEFITLNCKKKKRKHTIEPMKERISYQEYLKEDRRN